MISHEDFLAPGNYSTDEPAQSPRRPRTLTHTQMNAAIEKGLATSPLHRQDIQHYDDTWWQAHPTGWLEHTDPAVIATLNRRAAAMTLAAEKIQRNANIRAAME
jgi:hypothetical protein